MPVESSAASHAQAAASQDIRETVRAGYAAIARHADGLSQSPNAAASPDAMQSSAASCCRPTSAPTSCCGSDAPAAAHSLAEAIGYDPQQLASIPAGANLGLSCGNPTALASLRAGEVVLDLGSGAGFDVFIAGRRVGPHGRVIGVDMTPEMLTKARRNAAGYRAITGWDNVEFRLGEIEHLPIADQSVDVVISNCVLNLSPDKAQVWREIARVLRPGGRVAISDLALRRPLPEKIKSMVEAVVGCVAGAILIDTTRLQMQRAGLVDIELTPKDGYVDAMTQWNDPLYAAVLAELPAGTKASDYITSLDIAARAPRASGRCC